VIASGVRGIRSILLPAALVLLGACRPGGIVVREQVVRTEDGLVFPGPFTPRVMRVHPLTHPEVDAQGNARIVLHVELKDAWGDTVKGIGRVQAQLWRENQSADNATRWDIDLRGLGDNADFHDPATRTYRIVLAGLPVWFNDAVRDGTPTPARLRVLFLTADVNGTPVVMRDEITIRP